MLLKKSWACNWTDFHIKIFLFFACFTDIRLKVSPNSKSLIKIPLTVTIHVKNHRTYTAYICTQYKKLVFSIHITSNSITVACSTERKARLAVLQNCQYLYMVLEHKLFCDKNFSYQYESIPWPQCTNGTKYSRMDQVKFVEDRL